MRETFRVKTHGGTMELDTPLQKLLDKVKLALRVTTDAFDEELKGLIHAAERDLSVAGVDFRQETYVDKAGPKGYEQSCPDPLITRAVVTYCKLYFGEPERVDVWDRLKASYDEQKAQLSMASGYRRSE